MGGAVDSEQLLRAGRPPAHSGTRRLPRHHPSDDAYMTTDLLDRIDGHTVQVRQQRSCPAHIRSRAARHEATVRCFAYPSHRISEHREQRLGPATARWPGRGTHILPGLRATGVRLGEDKRRVSVPEHPKTAPQLGPACAPTAGTTTPDAATARMKRPACPTRPGHQIRDLLPHPHSSRIPDPGSRIRITPPRDCSRVSEHRQYGARRLHADQRWPGEPAGSEGRCRVASPRVKGRCSRMNSSNEPHGVHYLIICATRPTTDTLKFRNPGRPR